MDIDLTAPAVWQGSSVKGLVCMDAKLVGADLPAPTYRRGRYHHIVASGFPPPASESQQAGTRVKPINTLSCSSCCATEISDRDKKELESCVTVCRILLQEQSPVKKLS